MKIRLKENRYALWVLLIIFCVFQYEIRKICGFTLYPDEFGYWASAARAAGYDWSEVASLGSYYSFGYSLILLPILKLFGGGILAYRAALFLNMLLMWGSVLLIKKILERLFPETETETGFLLGGAAVLYPPWIFYMQMTMTEAVLFFLFLLDVELLLRFVEKQRMGTAVALSLSLAYGYCVHMRTLGLIIACGLTLLGWGIWGKGKKMGLLVWIAVLLGASAITVWLKGRAVAEVFSEAAQDVLAMADYSGQAKKLAEIFSLPGMLQLLKEIAGKLYYLGISSFGTIYFALYFCLKECVCLMKRIVKRIPAEPSQWIALFLLLSVMGQTAISSIFMYKSKVIDCLIYGRYNELLVPLMMAVGLREMMKSRFLVPVTMLLGTAHGVWTLFLLNEIESRGMSNIRGYHVPGISYFLKEKDLDVYLFFRNAWLLGFGMMLLVCVLAGLAGWRKSTRWMLLGILVMEIGAGLQISSHYIYKMNECNFQSHVIVEKLKEGADGVSEIWYLEEGTPPFVDFLQMQIPEKTIHVIGTEELDRVKVENSLLITSNETGQDVALSQIFDWKTTANPFCLYYN